MSSSNLSSHATNEAGSFPEILYNMLEEEDRYGDGNGPCRWAYEGKAFVIDKHHPQLVNLLRKHFSHGKFKSLQRQLNIYGFKKGIKKSSSDPVKYEGAIYHPHFQKGKVEELSQIKRRPPPGRLKAQEQKKLGTRKRKIRDKAAEAGESDSLIREAALMDGNDKNDYYYGSDNDGSTLNETSTLGEEDMDTDDNLTDAEIPENVNVVPTTKLREQFEKEENAHEEDGDKEEGGKVLKLAFKGEDDDDDDNSNEEIKPEKTTKRILLPFSLKKTMIVAYENMSHKRLVANLPARISISRAMQLYVDAKLDYAKSKLSNLIEDPEQLIKIEKRKRQWIDLAEGICVFFDKGVETRLLYKEELPQFRALQRQQQEQQSSTTTEEDDEKQPPQRMSEIYGCEHLLRMLLRLPDILAECVPEETRKRILWDMKEFVRFLHQHQDVLFATVWRRLTKQELEEIEKDAAAADVSDTGEG